MSGPVNENLPVVDGRDRTPEEKRAELAGLREELGDTVEALAHRVDVPAQVRERRDEVAVRLRERLGDAQAVLDEVAPPVGRVVRERPAWVVAGLVLLVVLVAGARRRSA